MSTNSAVSLTYQYRKQRVSLFLLLLNLTGSVHSTSATCYFPDGNIAATDTPCLSSGNSTCCGNGYACLSNRICMATGDEVQKPNASLYVRGSCTDQSWKDASCPLFCIGNAQLGSGGVGIAKCPNTALDEYYCIDPEDSSANCIAESDVLLFSGNELSKPSTLCSALMRYAGTPSILTTIGVIGTATVTSTTSSSTTLMTTNSTAVLLPPSSVAASSSTTSTATTTSTTTT